MLLIMVYIALRLSYLLGLVKFNNFRLIYRVKLNQFYASMFNCVVLTVNKQKTKDVL